MEYDVFYSGFSSILFPRNCRMYLSLSACYPLWWWVFFQTLCPFKKIGGHKAKYILKSLCSVACPTHSYFILILPQWCNFVCRTLYIKVIHEWLGLSSTLLEARQLLCTTPYGLWLVEHSTTQWQQWPSYVCVCVCVCSMVLSQFSHM